LDAFAFLRSLKLRKITTTNKKKTTTPRNSIAPIVITKPPFGSIVRSVGIRVGEIDGPTLEIVGNCEGDTVGKVLGSKLKVESVGISVGDIVGMLVG